MTYLWWCFSIPVTYTLCKQYQPIQFVGIFQSGSFCILAASFELLSYRNKSRMVFHFLSIFGHEKLNTCLENSGTVGEKCRSFFLACKQNKCVYWRLSLKCISSFLKRLLMYLHSLRNFDVQGVIKLHTILEAILSFYWILHGNGKYTFGYIQTPLVLS